MKGSRLTARNSIFCDGCTTGFDAGVEAFLTVQQNSDSQERPTVAVVGGGVSGLICARRLSQQGIHVTLFEAEPMLGGEIRTTMFAGHHLDMGAEAVHLSAPGMKELVTELGLSDELISSNPGMSWLWTRRGLRRLPAGVGPSGPRNLRPVLGSGVMSMKGLVRAALEPLVPRRIPQEDIGVGEYVSQRFGREVVERFVDPVLGSLHAGNVYKLSLRAITPELSTIADSGASVMMSRRGQKSGLPLSFATWAGGLSILVNRLLIGTDVEVRTSAPVDSIRTLPNGRFQIQESNGRRMEADGVVLAVPARIAAQIIRPVSQKVANTLEQIRYASVATALVAYPLEAVKGVRALSGTGLLVPSTRNRLLKAATFLTTKWPHLDDPNYILMRLSSGRADERAIEKLEDFALVEQLHRDLAEATGITVEPVQYFVQRWPEAIPQLEIGHLDLISQVRQELELQPGVMIAGSSYDGLGLATCLRSGERAAALCLSLIRS
ncbi:MAG: protoporphyrinogen oxidase [Candidatus Nanopelagicaceae bacterium]|nr:protoporphyrinogen oxidase [Candidatus Nanopelagicaceae bacterium]